MAGIKGLKDSFAGFFEEPTRASLRALLTDHGGESRFLDFKTEWPENSALAKQCLGMANTEGGCLVVGVQETDDKSLDPVGMVAFKDKADITNGLKNYLPSDTLRQITVQDFSYDSAEYSKIVGKRFQVLFIEYNAEHTPAISVKSGTGIRKDAIYYRKEGVTEEASYDEVKLILGKRTNVSKRITEKELDAHLRQLKVLYSAISEQIKIDRIWGVGSGSISSIMRMMSQDNPEFPKESYDRFVSTIISEKKQLIRKEIGVGQKD